ncbi:MAG: hypothetical protein KAY82_06705 [Hylemonella sp.]|nr:hypothetical protein [Hylemonella sp.]
MTVNASMSIAARPWHFPFTQWVEGLLWDRMRQVHLGRTVPDPLIQKLSQDGL